MKTTTTFRGKPCCSCHAKWLPAYEAELKRRGVIVKSLDIYQLNGSAPASAGTHKGGAADTGQTSDEAIWVARQMGADATWARTRAQGFTTPHAHSVLRGCPHNASARYQVTAVDGGYNGLGKAGQGGKDDGPRPLARRTWQEGIRWAEDQARAKVLPARVRKTRAQLKRDIAETTTEIKVLKAARKTAKAKRESLAVYDAAIDTLRRVRTEQRKAYHKLAKAPKR